MRVDNQDTVNFIELDHKAQKLLLILTLAMKALIEKATLTNLFDFLYQSSISKCLWSQSYTLFQLKIDSFKLNIYININTSREIFSSELYL